jgi:uncharacterized protein YeaC (DUF1315 family)
MRFIILIALLCVGAATAASTEVKPVPVEKDIISDIMALFDWAIGLLETFGFDIMDILGQFLPQELLDILQLLQDIGILPIAKRSIIDDLMAAIDMIMQLGQDAFDQLLDLLPPEILQILEMLFEIGAFPSKHIVKQGSIDEWLQALMETLFQLLGDNALQILIDIAADFGIDAALVQELWDAIIGGIIPASPSHAIRVDIIDWAIQMLLDFGLAALEQLAEFIPPEILSILIDLILGGGFPKA